MPAQWGIFAPDVVPTFRRLQTLGLSAVIRHYNDRSVPGLGGLWFGMPIAWSLLGIWLAEEIGAAPLPCANAVEAAVMVRALNNRAERARGRRILAGMNEPVFRMLSRRGAYVTQPYRMGTVEPLIRLGFVRGSGQRFNLYRLGPVGEEFLISFRMEKRRLLSWAQEGDDLGRAPSLGPEKPLPSAAAMLLERQLSEYGGGDEAARRRALLRLPEESFTPSPLLRSSPPGELSPRHWADLRSGIALVRMRDAALGVLAMVEARIGIGSHVSLSAAEAAEAAEAEIKGLAAAANVMLAETDSSPGQLGHAFSRLCLASAKTVVTRLADRDGTVIRLLPNSRIVLGPAGGERPLRSDETEYASSPTTVATAGVPELPRIANLRTLATDLQRSKEG